MKKRYAGGGLFTLLVSVVGLCATSRRSPCLLVFYALCLCLAFLVLVAGNFCQMDLPYFSVQAKKSQEQSAMLDASDPLDRGKMSKASSLLMIS